MHHDVRHAGGRDQRRHRWVDDAATDVVHHPSPDGQRRLGDGGPGGVDAHHGIRPGQCPDDRLDPPAFLGLVHPRRSRSGGLPADVDDVSAGGEHRQTVANRGRGVEVGVAIGERVGRDVEHPHHSTPTRRRVEPVVRALAGADAVVSIDTTRAAVAEAALAVGARMVNDVSGGVVDPAMAPLVATAGVPYVVMHSRGPSADMASRARYGDVVAEVAAELRERMAAALAAGVAADQIVLDPGLGFAKNAEHNWALLARLPVLAELDRPLLVGASRKGFLGRLLASPEAARPPADRDAATCAVTALAAYQGVWAVRVHDVGASVDAVRVVAALRAAA